MQDDDDFVVADDDLELEDDDEKDNEDGNADELMQLLLKIINEFSYLNSFFRTEGSSAKPTKRRLRNQSGNGAMEDERAETPPELKEWAKNLVTEEDRNRFELGNKLMLLLDVIKKMRGYRG